MYSLKDQSCIVGIGETSYTRGSGKTDFALMLEASMKAITDAAFDPLGSAEQLRDQEPAPVVGWLQKWSFDLACHKVTGAVRYNPDFAPAIAAVAAGLDLQEVLRFHRQMVRLQRSISHPLNARLFLEQLVLTYAALLRRGPLAA